MEDTRVEGQDADSPTGPFLPVGSTADFTYEVENTGNVDLVDIKVTDDKGVIVDCGGSNVIARLLIDAKVPMRW